VHERLQLLDLPLAEIRAGVRTVELLRDVADDFGARRVGEPLQLPQMFVEQLEGSRPLRGRPDEQGALDGLGDGDQIACDVRTSTGVSCRRAR
jgi:hypothetical protein